MIFTFTDNDINREKFVEECQAVTGYNYMSAEGDIFHLHYAAPAEESDFQTVVDAHDSEILSNDQQARLDDIAFRESINQEILDVIVERDAAIVTRQDAIDLVVASNAQIAIVVAIVVDVEYTQEMKDAELLERRYHRDMEALSRDSSTAILRILNNQLGILRSLRFLSF